MYLGLIDIEKMQTRIWRAPTCSTHGHRHLVICLSCEDSVWCRACSVRSCQCANDA